jgi:hypothetical protein
MISGFFLALHLTSGALLQFASELPLKTNAEIAEHAEDRREESRRGCENSSMLTDDLASGALLERWVS